MPAIVFTFGHGGSKSHWSYHYAGLLYAKLGIAVLAIDPIGEEERHARGQLGTRAHDNQSVDDRAAKVGRLIMGKLVFDTMRGIDFLLERNDIDHDRIGVVGNSLGGAIAGWMSALEPRIKMAIISGWAYDDIGRVESKLCTRIPNQRMRQICTWSEYAALAAPHCAVLIMNGDADGVIDRRGDGSAWDGTRKAVADASHIYKRLNSKEVIQCWFEPQGGHRPYFAYRDALKWIHQYLGTPEKTCAEICELPEVISGKWCDAHGISIEKRYATPLDELGANLVDLQLDPAPQTALKCLRSDELGSQDFTIDGWLQTIDASVAN